MSSRPSRNAPSTRPRIERRFPRPGYRPPRLPAPSRRVFRRRLDRPAFQRRLPKTFNSWLSLGLTLGIVLILGTSIAIFEHAYSDSVNPHISVGGVDLGGVALADAPSYLRRRIAERDRQPITLHVGKSTFQVTTSQFHASYTLQTALARAMADGHDADLFTRLWNQVATMVQGHDYQVGGTHDQAAVRAYLSQLNARIGVQPLPAVVGVRDNTVTILREPVPGRRLDLEAAATRLSQVVDSHAIFDTTLPIQITGSPISHDVAQATVNQAQTLLSQPIYFSSGTRIRKWFLSPDQLVRLLTFHSSFDQRKGYAIVMDIDRKRLRKTMIPIAADVDHAPTPAYYLVAEGSGGQPDSAVPQPDGPGLAIDADKTAQLILSAASTDHTVIIPLIHPHAAFDLAAARKLTFDTELGKGPTDLAGSSPLRIDNARSAAVALDNIRLQPGQTLSVTGVISPVVALGGYAQDLNRIAPTDISGVNGGTTQVASALFQAAYASGLPILQRQSYPYLTTFDGPIGGDAMVVARPQGPDLQFVNDTKHQLLINVVVYPKTHRVVAYMFTDGQVVHRSVKVLGPSVTLNQDGSVDASISRTIGGDTTGQDTISSQYDNLDPYP